MIHFQMTFDEDKLVRNGRYIDPALYNPTSRDYHPRMVCLTGDGHAKGTRDKSAVTCPRCLERMK